MSTLIPSKLNMNKDRPVLYINIIVLDATDAVHLKIKNSIAKSSLPKPLKRIAKRTAPTLAREFSQPKHIVQKLSQKLCTVLPKSMLEKGMQVSVEPVFHKGSYNVLQLQVHHVDLLQLLRDDGNDENNDDQDGSVMKSASLIKRIFISVIIWVFWVIGLRNQNILESYYIPLWIQSKLDKLIRTVLEVKFEERQLKAIAQVLVEAKQARFFYEMMSQLHQHKDKKDSKSDDSEEETTASFQSEDKDLTKADTNHHKSKKSSKKNNYVEEETDSKRYKGKKVSKNNKHEEEIITAFRGKDKVITTRIAI